MNDAIKKLYDYLAKSPSVIYPEDVLAYLPAIEDENTKLRELTVLQSVIFKHMSTCPTTDCQVCPVNDECAESVHLEGLLGIDDKETSWLVQWRSEDAADVRVENAKLRDVLKALMMGTNVELCAYRDEPDCKKCSMHHGKDGCAMVDAMELLCIDMFGEPLGVES